MNRMEGGGEQGVERTTGAAGNSPTGLRCKTNVRSSRLPPTKTGTTPTLTHAIGVTGQHEVLMVGLYTCDPAKVVSNSNHFTGVHTQG